MSTESFRRHTRRRVDAVIHRALASLADLPPLHRELVRLVRVAHRSDLLRALPPRYGTYPPVDALRNLACYPAAFTGDPDTWPGATGHPLTVVDSLARHMLGRYPTPRLLAQVWFGGETPRELARREWYVAHSRGRPFRTLELPFEMTRKMEHVFLRSRDHLTLDHALRRAEVLGLGGSEPLADAICATALGRSLEHSAFWRGVIEWLVRHDEQVALAQVAAIVEYAEAHRAELSLAGSSYASVSEAATRWRAARAGTDKRGRVAWARSRWAEGSYRAGDQAWVLVELVDSEQLRHEGRVMRHCVASYAHRCARGASSIWSLRRYADGTLEVSSVLTIEVDPRIATIVQIRGVGNSRRPPELAAELVLRWAKRERLEVARGELPTA